MMLDTLETTVRQSATGSRKAVEVLSQSAKLVRMLGGARLTMCKSGKDRTSMSVTLEQTYVLQQRFSVPNRARTSTLEALRTSGTRRQNARKNVGVPRFAFNALQSELLPKEYRPPPGTIGGRTVQT